MGLAIVSTRVLNPRRSWPGMPALILGALPMPESNSLSETNPLRQALPRTQVPEPCAVVLFGATGDLAHRKLVPALFQLARGGTCRRSARSSGSPAATGPTTISAPSTRRRLAKEGDDPEFRAVWTQFASRLFFASGTFDDPEGYREAQGDPRGARPHARDPGEPRLLPGGIARVLRDDHRAAGRGGPDLSLAAEEPLEPGGDREAVRPRPRPVPGS